MVFEEKENHRVMFSGELRESVVHAKQHSFREIVSQKLQRVIL